MNILFVDDEPDILFTLQEWFTKKGHNVSCLENIENLGACLHTQKYDVVCLDLLMCHSPGLAVIEEVRDMSPDTTVIVMSGMCDPRLAKLAIQHGAAAFVAKPVALPKLQQILERSRTETARKNFTGPISFASHIKPGRA